MRVLIIILLFSINTYSQCLSGNCENGIGIRLYDTDKYVGEFKNSERHGSGTLYYSNEKKSFTGIWKEDGAYEGLNYNENEEIDGIFISGELIYSHVQNKTLFDNLLIEYNSAEPKKGKWTAYVRDIISMGKKGNEIYNYYLMDLENERRKREREVENERIKREREVENERLRKEKAEKEQSMSFREFLPIAQANKTQENKEKLWGKLKNWSDYETFLSVFPEYTNSLQNKAYEDLQARALSKDWCSYCCEVYLKLFKNNQERRTDVMEWRRFAYAAENADANRKVREEASRKAAAEQEERISTQVSQQSSANKKSEAYSNCISVLNDDAIWKEGKEDSFGNIIYNSNYKAQINNRYVTASKTYKPDGYDYEKYTIYLVYKGSGVEGQGNTLFKAIQESCKKFSESSSF